MSCGRLTDCLLQHGAAHVYAIDTGYGVLEYKLRINPRITVMERTNALHAEPPDEPVDLVTIDAGWTKQHHVIPAARRWLKSSGRIVTLVKPHYELTDDEKRDHLAEGRLDPDHAERVLKRIMNDMTDWSVEPIQWTRSPITGAKSGRRSSAGRSAGNVEFLVLCQCCETPQKTVSDSP